MKRSGLRKQKEAALDFARCSRLARLAEAVRRDSRGAVYVEFALIAIPFIGLLLTIVETGIVFLVGLSLDGASGQLARLIQTGQLQQANVTTVAALKATYVCPASGKGLIPAFIPCSALIVDVRNASGFTTADLSSSLYSNPSALRFCPGGAGTVVALRLGYALPVFLPTLAMMANGVFGQLTAGLVNDVPGHTGWSHFLASSRVFQNENFSSSGGATC